MKQNTWFQLFVIYLRYLLGFAFVFASLVKIQGLRFTAEPGLQNPIDSAWHFFETLYASGIYWRFIGVAQLVTGALLLTQRYAKLGAVLFLPIIANIFVITISYDFNGTPIITGLMLISTLFLLYWDWESVKVLVNQTPTGSTKTRLENDPIWMIQGIFFLVVTILGKLFLRNENVFYIFLLLFLIGMIGLIVGHKRQRFYLN